MSIEGAIAIATTVVVFLTVQLRRSIPTEFVFLAGLVFVTLCGVITPEQALAGFSSNAILTIGGLLICAAGLRETGVMDWFGERLLGGAQNERSAQVRLFFTLLILSAFLLNTIVVIMLMPILLDWCRKRHVAPSRMLIPLSYLTILGGVCSLIGTSTTLVVNSEMRAQFERHEQQLVSPPLDLEANDVANVDLKKAFVHQLRPMTMFEIGYVGLPCAVVGGLTLLLLGPKLLPDRRDMIEQFGEQRREYLVELRVEASCPLIGRTVEQAGLRQLPGLFLIEINRANEVVTPVSPSDVLRADDRLIFSGVVRTIVDLEKIPGLTPVADDAYESDPRLRQGRNLTEVVLSRSCPLIGSSIREGAFRRVYNAAVIAVHRNGVRLTNKIGNIVLEPGDTLLLQTTPEFVSRHRNSRDFYLVSTVEGARARRNDRALLAAILALILVGWLATTSFLKSHELLPGFASTAIAAIAVAGVMVASRCVTAGDARRALDLPLLFTIAGALGLAKAVDESHAAETIARGIISIVGSNPWFLLISVYVMTMIFTEMITNNAVAATLIPIAVRVAEGAALSPRPFVMAIAIAASLSFLTPIGYQTNLMIMGPGGYRPQDYLRVGLPIALTVAVTAITLIPKIWPFILR